MCLGKQNKRVEDNINMNMFNEECVLIVISLILENQRQSRLEGNHTYLCIHQRDICFVGTMID